MSAQIEQEKSHAVKATVTENLLEALAFKKLNFE